MGKIYGIAMPLVSLNRLRPSMQKQNFLLPSLLKLSLYFSLLAGSKILELHINSSTNVFLLINFQKLLSEYSSWLESSYVREANFYAELFNKRWNTPVDVKDKAQPDTCVLVSKGGELSTKVLEGFSASAAARVFEQEIREVVSSLQTDSEPHFHDPILY